MGRPLNKKYFGNTNTPSVGGEAIASVTVGGTNNAYTSLATLTFADPDIPGGVTATGSAIMGLASVASIDSGGTGYVVGDVITVVGLGAGTAGTLTVSQVDGGGVGPGVVTGLTITTVGAYSTVTDVTELLTTNDGSGDDGLTVTVTLKIASVTIGEDGGGYTSAPAITVSGNATLTAVLTTGDVNAILAEAYVVSANELADIIKQVASRRFKVETSEGIAKCRLIGGLDGDPTIPNAVGLMMIEAQDSGGNEYNVYKLTAHRATLKQKGGAGHEFDDNTSVPWTFDAATLNETVKIING